MAKGAHKGHRGSSRNSEAAKKTALRSGAESNARTPTSLGGAPTDRLAAPKVQVSADGNTITVFLPMTFRKFGGRKLVITPTGHDGWAPSRPHIDTPLLNAVVRAFHWKELLDSGEYPTVEELAAAEDLNASYLGKVLRLTLLAPDIVEAILDGRQKPTMQLQPLLRQGFTDDWELQETAF